MPSLPALAVEDLTIDVGGKRLVDRVSLSVASGERVALLGPSGSGKSLTAAALQGTLPPAARAAGQLRVGGLAVSLRGLLPGQVPLAAVQQESLTALNPLVRLDRQLGASLGRRAGRTRQQTERVLAGMLASVGFEEPAQILASYPPMLSGGQRQRICLVQALACSPAVLVADEPTTALDVLSQAAVLQVLEDESARGLGILFITHDFSLASSLCSRAVVLENGRVVEAGSFEELTRNPRQAYTQSMVRSALRSAARAENVPA